jgi:hypothetical protein
MSRSSLAPVEITTAELMLGAVAPSLMIIWLTKAACAAATKTAPPTVWKTERLGILAEFYKII